MITIRRSLSLDVPIGSDPNTLIGAIAAHSLDPELIIMGEARMTSHGEILAMYMPKVIPPGLSPEETIKRLRIKVHLLVSRNHLIPGEADLGSQSTYLKSSLWWMFWRFLTLVAWFRKVISGRPNLPKYFTLPVRLGQTPM